MIQENKPKLLTNEQIEELKHIFDGNLFNSVKKEVISYLDKN